MACCRFCRCAEMLIKSKVLNGYRLLSTLLLEQEGDDAGAAAPRPPAAQACACVYRAARRRVACALSADMSDTRIENAQMEETIYAFKLRCTDSNLTATTLETTRIVCT